MTRIENIISLLKANTGVADVASSSIATYANLADTVTLGTISSSIMAGSVLKAGFEIAPVADVVEQMFISLFGYTQAEMTAIRATEAGAEGFAYWTNELANNSTLINVNTLAIALLNGAGTADQAKASALVANDVADLAAYAGSPETPVETVGLTTYLTAGQDILTGTDGNDTFIARGNNTLTNSDIIDGGKGTDTVKVMLDKGETAESPSLTNIEVLQVQVQATTTTSGTNDVDNTGAKIYQSNIDAGDMAGVATYINDNSRADLTIEDVSHNSNITNLVMRETDMGGVDYNVFFDPQNIKAAGSADAGSTLLIKLANVLNIAEKGNAVDKFESLSFKIGTTTITADISAATSYDDVVTALQTAITASGIVGLTVTKQAAAPAYFSIDVSGYSAGQSAGSYNPILITNTASGILTAGTIAIANDTVNANMVNTMTNVVGTDIPALTSTNVVFDRVGRDSQGGDFLAGSDSTGASGSKGIQQFDISVDRSSKLNSVSSTNNTLEVLNIKNIKENSDGNGNLTIKSVTDVRVIDAATMTGSADITATLSDKVTTKYLNLTDTQANNAADNSESTFLNVVDTYFSYDFGSKNDTFNLTIDGSNLAAAGTTAREDFVMDINGNGGNDKITTAITAMTEAGYANSKMNANLTINAGEGDDTIWTKGAGDFKINAGTGTDTVYTDNTGALKVAGVTTQGVNAVKQAITYTLSAAVATGETLSITINGTTYTQVFTTDAATTYAALKTSVDVSAVVMTVSGNALTVTADTAGIAFTVTPLSTTNATTTVASSASVANVVAVAEQFTVTFADGQVGQNIMFDGKTTVLSDTNNDGIVSGVEVATQVLAASGAAGTVYAASPVQAGNTLAYTAKTAGLTTDVKAADFTGSYKGASVEATSYNEGRATFVLNASNTDINDLQANALTTVKYAANLGLTVTFQGVTTKISEVASSFNTQKAVAITDLNVNQAIKAAINNDVVLNKVLIAVDGPANTLIVKSLIDGEMATTDFNVNLINVTAAAATQYGVTSITAASISSQTTALQAALVAELTPTVGATQAATDATTALASVLTTAGSFTHYTATSDKLATQNGADLKGAVANNLGSDNTIDLGTGNDVLVLSTSTNSAEKIVYKDAAFGNDTIFNFNTTTGDATSGTGIDKLDFSAFVTKANTFTKVDLGTKDTAATFNSDYAADSTQNITLALAAHTENTTAGTTSMNLVFLTDATSPANSTIYAYQVTDGAALTDEAATFLGSITFDNTSSLSNIITDIVIA